MSFLNPLFLLGALAVVGPILVHLYRRQETRKIPFSSLLFISHTPSRSWRRLRLRNLLLLAMRALAVVLLVLAFARPYFATQDPVVASSGRKSVVLLIDNSLSMRSGDTLEKAKTEALNILAKLRDGDSCHLVAFSDNSHVLSQPHSDRRTLSALIGDVRPSFRPTDFGQALRLGGQLLSSSPNDTQEIHLISDFQQTGWKQETAGIAIPKKVQVIAHNIGQAGNRNAAVARVEVSETGDRSQPKFKVAARIVSNEKASVPVRLEVNDKVVAEKSVQLEPGRTTLVEFEPFPPATGINRGKVSLNSTDGLDADNAAFFVVNPLNRHRLLLLADRDGTRKQEGFAPDVYIRKALVAGSGALFDVTTEDLETTSADLTAYSAVLIVDPANIPARLGDKLTTFVDHGGGLILAAGNRADVKGLNGRLKALLPAQLVRKRQAPSGGVALIANIQKQHNIFRVFEPVHQSYFLTTPFRAYLEATPVVGSATLMELDKGAPLLLERAVGKGRVLLYTSSFNTDWNDLPLKSVFLPFCHELVKYAMRLQGDSDTLHVGESVPVNRLNPNFEKALEKVSGSGAAFSQDWKVSAPSGQAIKLSEEELLHSPFLVVEEPGFYETQVWNLSNLVAVNLDPAESDLTPVDPKHVLQAIERTAGTVEVSEGPGTISAEQRTASERRQGLWWYLVAAALGLLVLEGILANRYVAAGE
ncbi:MAG: VWA domain-containing protein [Acidobacteria bacterium]|nr:MAG: VWA domain-containing protein [Acidobacteriota bacterium]